MKKSIPVWLGVAVMLVTLAAGPVLATDSRQGAEASAFTLEHPASALEFQVDQDFSLSSLEGSMISWKRLSSASRGWRVGLSPIVGHNKREETYSFGRTEETLERYSLDLSIQRLWLREFRDRTRLYWGAGPFVGASYLEDRRVHYYDDPDREQRVTKDIERSFRAGVSAVLGVEFFFLDTMSLLAEYRFESTYVRAFSTLNEEDETYWDFSPRPVRLGLSVLF